MPRLQFQQRRPTNFPWLFQPTRYRAAVTQRTAFGPSPLFYESVIVGILAVQAACRSVMIGSVNLTIPAARSHRHFRHQAKEPAGMSPPARHVSALPRTRPGGLLKNDF
jgi:hypothetical protein